MIGVPDYPSNIGYLCLVSDLVYRSTILRYSYIVKQVTLVQSKGACPLDSINKFLLCLVLKLPTHGSPSPLMSLVLITGTRYGNQCLA